VSETDLAAQDSNEPFDLIRADGVSLGRTKPRAAVHRDGDWHRSLHVWVAGRDVDGAPWLLFQRRGLGKDTWPGLLDPTVGGHYRAGEGLAQALREVEEEIGVPAALADLRRLGTRVCVHEDEAGVCDHELQDVFLRRDDRPLTAYRPHPAELAALVRLPLAPLLAFLVGEAITVAGEALSPGAAAPVPTVVAAGDFIPNVDQYVYRVAVAVAAAFRGDRHIAV